MTKYILLTLGSFGYFIYILLTSLGHNIRLHEYYDLIAPILLSVSAGLFITNKTKGAAIFGLIGLTMTSKNILSNWFIIDVIHPKYTVQIFAFVSLTTIYLFLLGFVAVKSLLNSDNNHFFEIIKYQPSGTTAKVLSIVPTVVVVVATIVWLTTMQL